MSHLSLPTVLSLSLLEKGTLNSAVIAVLAVDDINEQKVVYQKNAILCELLNAKDHATLAGQLAAYVCLDVRNKVPRCCLLTLTSRLPYASCVLSM